MESFSYTVKDKNGIHARPAGIIVNCAKRFESSVTVECNEKSADCKRLFAVMSLGALEGDVLKITAVGCDEATAAKSVKCAMEEAGL